MFRKQVMKVRTIYYLFFIEIFLKVSANLTFDLFVLFASLFSLSLDLLQMVKLFCVNLTHDRHTFLHVAHCSEIRLGQGP